MQTVLLLSFNIGVTLIYFYLCVSKTTSALGLPLRFSHFMGWFEMKTKSMTCLRHSLVRGVSASEFVTSVS